MPCAFIIFFQARTRARLSAESMSATDRGSPSEKGAVTSSQPGGRTPNRLASRAAKILAFSPPNPGSASSRRTSSRPSAAPVHTAAASPP